MVCRQAGNVLASLRHRGVRGFVCRQFALAGLLALPILSYAQPVATANHRLAIRQEAIIAQGVLHYGERHLRHEGERCAALDSKIRGACYARMSRDAIALAAGTPPTPACPVLSAQLAYYFQASALLMNTCAQGHHCFNGEHPVPVEILRVELRRMISTGLNGVCD